MILNNQYGIEYTSNGTVKTIHLNNYNLNQLYMNSDMSYFTNYFYNEETEVTNCAGNLQLNLSNFNVKYDYVVNMSYAFAECYNITGSPVCGPKVTDMSNAYMGCANLIGSPVCGQNVTDMSATYAYCSNLTGNPVCGNNVVNMCFAYMCYEGMDITSNLTGSPVCGNNVTNMSWAYLSCTNLTGSPACGNNVTNMDTTYLGCVNLTGNPVCGPNVTNMGMTYAGCPNLYGKMFMLSDNVQDTYGMFINHNNQNRINIFVKPDTITNSSLYSNQVWSGGDPYQWTLDTPNNRYYQSDMNIYVYYNWNGQIW